MAMYTHILTPTDGSELAGKAVQHGSALAKLIGAKVTVLTVLPPPMITSDRGVDETILVAVAKQAADITCDMIHVEHEDPLSIPLIQKAAI